MTASPSTPPTERSPLARVLFAFDISQAELAAKSGLTRQTIADAYHDRGVSLETWVRIAKALQVPLRHVSPESAELIRGIVVE